MTRTVTPTSTTRRTWRDSLYITWFTDWFLGFFGRSAQFILIVTTIYQGAALLPGLSLPAPVTNIVFIVQMLTLDIGGMGLARIARQAQDAGDEEGAAKAGKLSKWLIRIVITTLVASALEMIARPLPFYPYISVYADVAFGIVSAGLTIGRAICAVQYGQVMHGIHIDPNGGPHGNGGQPVAPSEEVVQELVRKSLEDQAAQYDQRLADLDAKYNQHINLLQIQQSTELSRLKAEQERALSLLLSRRFVSEEKGSGTGASGTRQLPPASGTPASGTKQHGTGASGTRQLPPAGGTSSLPEQPSNVVPMLHKAATSATTSTTTTSTTNGARTAGEIATDNVVWPLLDVGKTCRTIETETNISKSVVARSRQRWSAARGTADSGTSNLSQEAEAENGTADSGTSNLSQEQSA